MEPPTTIALFICARPINREWAAAKMSLGATASCFRCSSLGQARGPLGWCNGRHDFIDRHHVAVLQLDVDQALVV